jgi:hypothetical protein
MADLVRRQLLPILDRLVGKYVEPLESLSAPLSAKVRAAFVLLFSARTRARAERLGESATERREGAV